MPEPQKLLYTASCYHLRKWTKKYYIEGTLTAWFYTKFHVNMLSQNLKHIFKILIVRMSVY
jgi:hypothetical protein